MKSGHDKTAVTATLIDPLEQRLLYSADHPLGLAVALGDDNGFQDDLQADHLSALTLAASIEESESNAPRAVAFVETVVPDFDELSERLESQGIVVHAIDSAESGVDQVTDYLSGYSELDSVMFFSHGVESGFSLGNNVVNSDFLSTVESEIQAWGNALSKDGDLLLFGCDVAEDEAGQAFLGRLAELTQADVAASDDTTGHVDRGGNWNLEWTSGAVNTSVLETTVLDDWQGSLASIIVTTTLDTVDAADLTSYAALQLPGGKGADNEISLREAVEVANNDASVSLISLSGGTDYVLTSGELTMSGTFTVAGVSAVDTVIDQLDTARVVNVASGDVTLTNLTLTGADTIAAVNGGGLFINSGATAQLESVIIRNNLSGLHGAGIYNAGFLTAQDVRLTQNTATEHGGGIYNIANMTLNRVTIDDNTSIRDGGGIHQQGDGQSSTLDYVTISGNDGVRGGGISAKGDVTIRNSTIINNTAVNDGAGIREHGITGTITLYNTVLANNTQSGGDPSLDDMFGDASSLGFNFIEKVGSITLAATDIQGADPGLSGLVLDAGGISKTHVPTADSPLINRGGSVSSLVDATGYEIDTIPDIGAHEVQGPNGVLFWTDGISQIFRSDAAGNYAQTLMTGLNAPLDLEVDAGTGRIYWLEDDTYLFRSALPDGSDIQTHFTSNDSAVSFALDINAGHVYIAEWNIPGQSVYSIQRYLLADGSFDMYISPALKPTDLDFDVTTNTLHWLEASVSLISESSIDHLNLTTGIKTDEEIDNFTDISTASALVLNAGSGRLYWVDENRPSPGKLGVQDLADLQIVSVNTISDATGITFDTLNDRVIITTGEDGRLLSYDADLGSYQELYSSVDEAGSIAYLAIQNTAPLLIANTGATLDEGSSTTFSEATLLYEDDETDSINLTYTITTEPVEGEIQKFGVQVSTFTQEDINEDRITYLNNGNHVGVEADWTDSFSFQLSDGLSTFSNQLFTLSINDVPDTLLLQANTGSSQNEGATKILTSTELSYSDVDTAPTNINYTATAHPAGGKLLVNSVEQLTFTQDDLDNNRVAYQDAGAHEGFDSSWTESFTFTVTDGTFSFVNQSFVLTINDVPDTLLLQANTGSSQNEGATKILTATELNYTDVDTAPANINYTATAHPTGGKLLVNSVEQLTFTQDDLDNNRVAYRDAGAHEGFDSSWTESFTFTVTDGTYSFDNQSFVLTINDVPDTLVLQANTGSSQNEGATKILTATELSYSDVDTAPININYTATAHPAGGKLLVNSVEQLTFTQDDLDNNRVAYQDAGAHEGFDSSWTESFTFTVTDGTFSFVNQSFVLTINDVPDTLLLQANTGSSQNEGATKILTATELNYTDVDTAPANINYTATAHPAGGKLLVNSIEQLTFTQDDLDNNRVAYRDAGAHEGFDSSWTESFTFTVTDGTYSFDNQSFVLTINDVPDPLVLQANNGSSLDEGGIIVLTPSELNVTDVDTAPADIHYTVSNMPASGAVFVAGVEQLTFTQENLNNGVVAYRNDGSHTGFETSWTENFGFSVTDGDNTISNETFTLTINDVPGAPVMQANNGLSLDEGAIKVITTSELNVTDVDTSPSAIIYTVSAHPTGGKMLVGGVEQLTFTQEDLNNGDVAYQDAGTHEGFETSWTQSFNFSVTDSVHSIYSQTFVMTITDVPDPLVLQVNNGLSLDEGEIKVITTSELNVTDVDTAPSAIVYTASSHPAGGRMLVGGLELLTFTQENLNNGEVAYRDDGSHAGFESSWTESFQFSITDGTTSIDNQTFILTVNDVPDAPVFSTLVGVSLQEGSLMTLTAAHLTVTDVDTDSDEIIYTVTASNSGQLLVDGRMAETFSQTDLIDGLVAFQHDGSEPSVESSVSFNVSDGTTILPADTLVFSINPVHDEAPVAMDHDLSGNRGELFGELQTGALTLLDGVSDNDEPVGTLLVSLETAALHGTVSINADGTFSYLHDGTETFSDSFTYTVTDEGGNTSAPAVVTIDISGNTTPVANGDIAPQTATEMQVFTLTLDSNLFSDTADDSLAWQAARLNGSELPQWLSFDSVNRTFSGTPGDADTGNVELRVHAVDIQGAESAAIHFTLTVNDVNQSPFLSVESQSTIQENQPGAAITTISASDPDLTDTVTVSVNDARFQIEANLLSLKPGMSLDHELEPEILLTITASDESGETAASLLSVQVLDTNDTPVLATDIRAIELETDSVTVIPINWFTDQDGNSLTYTWKLASGEALPDWIMFDQQSMTLSLGEVPENASTQSVVLTVDDGRGGVVQLLLDLQLPSPVIAPANPVVEPTPAEPEPEVLLSTFDLDELPSDNSTAGAHVPKDSLKADDRGKSEANNSVAALGVSASGIIPHIVDVDPVSAEDLSERIQSIKDARVISDQIGDAFKNKRVDLSKPSTPDVFHSTTNLNDLFSTVQRQDTQTLSELAREFQQQREEMESREKFNSTVVGSSITLSSGLSVGYLIYLIRGGAIVSSMLSSLPAWRFVDPLPILSSMDGGMDTDGETLASIVSQDSGR